MDFLLMLQYNIRLPDYMHHYLRKLNQYYIKYNFDHKHQFLILMNVYNVLKLSHTALHFVHLSHLYMK